MPRDSALPTPAAETLDILYQHRLLSTPQLHELLGSRYAERSSLPGLLTTKIPLMIAAAELDPPRFVEQFNLLKQATCKGPNGCARATMVPQHSHMSEVYSINAVGTRLTDEILDFVKTGK